MICPVAVVHLQFNLLKAHAKLSGKNVLDRQAVGASILSHMHAHRPTLVKQGTVTNAKLHQ